MSTEMTAVITLAGGIIVAGVTAGATYIFTKWREREAEWRKEKREHYKAFMASCSGNVEGDDTPEGKLAFNRAANDLILIAPKRVLEALISYRKEISISNQENYTRESHDRAFSKLLYEMRKDLEMSPRDDKKSFHVFLWASGNKSCEKDSV